MRSAAERRHITVLFCDIVGSTPMSTELDPEELREILIEYQRNVAAAVTAERGYIARFVGDGVLAYFGWPNADETHPESAVRAGLAIIDTVSATGLSLRIGIATGLVVTGDLVGVGAAQTMTAVGESAFPGPSPTTEPPAATPSAAAPHAAPAPSRDTAPR